MQTFKKYLPTTKKLLLAELHIILVAHEVL